MGITTAGSLLRIYSTRLEMAQSGATHPSAEGRNLFKRLVDELTPLDPEEPIDVQIISEDPMLARFVRARTGVVLAELAPPSEGNTR